MSIPVQSAMTHYSVGVAEENLLHLTPHPVPLLTTSVRLLS